MMSDKNDILLATAQQNGLERGFKTWAENASQNIRKRLGLNKYAPLSPYVLADYLNVKIITPLEIPELSSEAAEYLTSEKGSDWSAVTLRFKGKDVIIYNPSHSAARTASTLMHELSHILRSHKSERMIMTEAGITIRDYNSVQEQEADCLAATLLLPRD